MMKLRDDIQNFDQQEGEPIHESCTRFKRSLRKCPTQGPPDRGRIKVGTPENTRKVSIHTINRVVGNKVGTIIEEKNQGDIGKIRLTRMVRRRTISTCVKARNLKGVQVAIRGMMEDEDTQKLEESEGVEEQDFLIQQGLTKEPEEEKDQQVQVPKVIHPLPMIPPPFPQRLKKKNEDEKFKFFSSVFKSLSFNLPLVEALLEMLGYAKFMKELVRNKRSLEYETIEVPHSCSAIMTNDSITKREDPGALTIPYTIGMLQFAKPLCDLGASINLMPYAIYKLLCLGEPKVTTMRLLMADRSIKHPVGILYDIIVKGDLFLFSADFVILDCEIDVESPIILGRPFLFNGRALVDVESGKLKFHVNEDEVTFNICKSMKQPSNIYVVSTEDVIYKEVASVSHLMRNNELLEFVLANYDEFEVQGYEEVVAALSGLGAYSTNPIKLDINLKNKESPLLNHQ
ncbi:uncharacterized protein LOC125873816 [Solanum stenotomum]|uniref:uncharacterized protein LOC125873816 n=1 Tax=Solanum stenotomum TaxID=172797 RepID=UPI0020D10C81|nr:uncharacterized protein LOC125873816 [Solanum stenotomum]